MKGNYIKVSLERSSQFMIWKEETFNKYCTGYVDLVVSGDTTDPF